MVDTYQLPNEERLECRATEDHGRATGDVICSCDMETDIGTLFPVQEN
jgi:hypothetical protein